MKLFAESIASASKVTVAVAPMERGSPCERRFLGLVEETAALEHPGPFLGRDLDVAWREQEDLVGEASVLVPLLVPGGAEVDEGLVPDVGEAHGCAESYSGRRSPKMVEPTRM